MYMTGMTDEVEFDAFAATMDLRPLAPDLRIPYLVLAGENDELSPISNTFDLLHRMPGPAEFVLYQGEKHSVGGSPAAQFGPNRHHYVANWIAERFWRSPASDRFLYVESTGRVVEQPPTWRA
jgi:pimeloyl-ACP methyl ester carboxylesterase